jgi:D-inositol-3-phosphate glycosyltransferase
MKSVLAIINYDLNDPNDFNGLKGVNHDSKDANVDTKQLRIAVLSIHSNPIGELGTNDTGGMSVYIRELTSELAKRGHRIDIYTRLRNGRHQPVIDLFENVRLVHLGIPHSGSLSRLALYPYLTEFLNSMEAFRSREGIEYDLIHSHYWLSGKLGSWAQELWDRPHLVMLHTLGQAKNCTGVGRPEPELRIAAEKELVNTCHRIIAPTDREKDSLMHHYGVDGGKIGVVPCGVNLDLFQPVQKQVARKHLGFDADDTILLNVGRFEPLKGIDRLLEAMIHLHNHRRLRLVIVGGDGPEAPESQFLRRKAINLGIEDKVLFAGRVEQEYLPLYYGSADVLVMASHYESFGLVGLEALACGRPVVSTPVGAMDSLIEQSKAGHIVSDTRPLSLARGIVSIITNAKLPPANQIRKSVKKYSWSNVASEILNEYETAIRHQNFENECLLSAEASCG